MLKPTALTLFVAFIVNSSISLAVAPVPPSLTVTCEVSTESYVLEPKAPVYPQEPKVSKLVIPLSNALYFEGAPDWNSKDLYHQEAGPYTLYAFSSRNTLDVFITKTGEKRQLVYSTYQPKQVAAGVSFTGIQLMPTDSSQGSGGIAYRCYNN